MKQNTCWSLVVLALLTAAVQAAPPTDAELEALGKSMVAALRAGDAKAYGQHWNNPALIDRVTKNIAADPAVKAGFTQGMSGFGTALGDQLIKNLGDTGSCSYLGLQKVEGETRPLVRIFGDTGLNYQQLVVERDSNGALKVVDVFAYAVGDTLSQIQRRLYIQLALRGRNEKPPESVQLLSDMQQKAQAGDFKGVLARFDAAPESARKERAIHIFRITAAMRMNDDAVYFQALEDFRKYFKDDATADLLAIDVLFSKKQYKEAGEALDRLDKAVGTDPLLNLHRGNLAYLEGDPARAKKLHATALADEPTAFASADYLLTDALEQKDYPTARKYLVHIETHHPRFRFGDLKGVELFEGFVNSPEYAKWQQERPPQKSAK